MLKPVNLENKSVQRILSAAMSCWGRSGYHGASLKDIAAEAGVAKSLLHYHFASKEHLLIELQAQYNRQVAADIRARLANAGPSIQGALDALDQCWDAMVHSRDQFPFTLEVWRASLTNEAVRARLDEFRTEMFNLMHDGILQALGPHAEHLRLPAPRLAALLLVVLEGFSLHLWLTGDVKHLRRIFDDFKTLIAASVLPGSN